MFAQDNSPSYVDYITLYGKIQARAIHRYRNTPENERPHISEKNIERGHRLAHQRILSALEYLHDNDADHETDDDLKNAAQLLEKLYLSEPDTTPQRTQELYNAALAYYLAGHYARAFVIMRGIKNDGSSHDALNLMRLMFLKQIKALREASLEFLSIPLSHDISIANQIECGQTDEQEAIDQVLNATIHRIFGLFYVFACTGDHQRIQRAIDLALISRQIAIEQGLEDWWWLFYTTSAFLKEYTRNSLWTLLKPLIDEDNYGLVKNYIKACLYRKPYPVLELWRSQAHTIKQIQDRSSYCLKMPTSSGKTRIAELAILQFLLDTHDTQQKKCLYIAPFRALALEVEQSLSSSFDPIGAKVSQLYGSYDLNPAEELLVKESRILIGTPEKLDALLRYDDSVVEQVGLIIIDEGHIIDSRERGIRFELFVHRLVRRFALRGIRILFISAVMPNVEDFCKWITGKNYEDGILESTWRATQQMLGIISWNGYSGRIDYLYRDLEALDQDFFIPYYFRPFDPKHLKSAGCNRRKFPPANATKGQLAGLAAVNSANEGATLIFVGRKQDIKGVAEAIIEVIELQSQINNHQEIFRNVLPFNLEGENKDKFDRCIRYAIEATGEESIVVRALKCGFVVHHANVPRSLRVQLENLIRAGVLQLIVATSTLAQGVNLPVKTVIVHSLQQGRNERLKARDFWNICGRAGRAMYETEGSILVLVNGSRDQDEYKNMKEILHGYVQQATSQNVTEIIESSIRSLLNEIIQEWQSYSFDIGIPDIAELCDYLGSNLDISMPYLTTASKRKIRILDMQLLALLEEAQIEIAKTDIATSIADFVEDVFQNSMLYIQLSSSDTSIISYPGAVLLLSQRLQYVLQQASTPEKRKRYYKMGVSLDDCITIDSQQETLKEVLLKAENYMVWTPQQRIGYIIEICENYLINLKDVQESTDTRPPDCWRIILSSWLHGQTPDEISLNLDLPSDWQDPMEISTLLDNLCEFQLPWGLNAISMIWVSSKGTDTSTFSMPEIIKYFPSLLRFGVHDPVAATLLAAGIENRKASIKLAGFYKGTLDAYLIYNWVKSLNAPDLIDLAEDDNYQIILDFIKRNNKIYKQAITQESAFLSLYIELPALEISRGNNLEAYLSDNFLHLFSQDHLEYIGSIEVENPVIKNKYENGDLLITVEALSYQDNIAKLDILIH